jgi:hypothetical protein
LRAILLQMSITCSIIEPAAACCPPRLEMVYLLRFRGRRTH